jgi:translation elongation factor P/translation initiation factor 5A
MTLAKDLKKGDKIVFDSLKLTIENVEVSKIAKHGKAKCRLEALTEENEKKVFITPADEEIQSQ